MRVAVDFDIWVEEKAYGALSGTLDLEGIPPIGSSISLDRPYLSKESNRVSCFSVFPKIEKVILTPLQSSRDGPSVMLVLQAVHLKSDEDAKKVIAYCESGFGMIGMIF